MSTIRRVALLACASILTQLPTMAQQAPRPAPCLTKAADLKEKVAELNAPDPMRRLAMFNEMLASCDPAQREIAFERAAAATGGWCRAAACPRS